MNHEQLKYVDSVKYLGVILSKDFSDNLDIQRQLRSLYARANTILAKFSYCTLPVKCSLLETFCMNFYCAYLWSDYTKTVHTKFRVAYNTIYRKLLGTAGETVPVVC